MSGIPEVCRFLSLRSSNQTTHLHKYVLAGEQRIAMPKTNKKYFSRTHIRAWNEYQRHRTWLKSVAGTFIGLVVVWKLIKLQSLFLL